MKDIIEKHALSDGRTVWIQRHKIPGIRKPFFSVVVCDPALLIAPQITDRLSKEQAFSLLADILKADVLETLF